MKKFVCTLISAAVISFNVSALPYNDISDPDLFIQKNLPLDVNKVRFNPLTFSMWAELYTVAAGSCVASIDANGVLMSFETNHWCMNFMGPNEFTEFNRRAFNWYNKVGKNEPLMEMYAVDAYTNAAFAKTYKARIEEALKELCTYEEYSNSEFCN